MKWKSAKELPQNGQIIVCFGTYHIYDAEYIGIIIGNNNHWEPSPHMLIRLPLGMDPVLSTFDEITALYWIPIEEFEKGLKNNKGV